MFLLSPFAKGGGKREYHTYVHYDHSSTLKTLEEIFDVEPLLGAAADDKRRISAIGSAMSAMAIMMLTIRVVNSALASERGIS